MLGLLSHIVEWFDVIDFLGAFYDSFMYKMFFKFPNSLSSKAKGLKQN